MKAAKIKPMSYFMYYKRFKNYKLKSGNQPKISYQSIEINVFFRSNKSSFLFKQTMNFKARRLTNIYKCQAINLSQDYESTDKNAQLSKIQILLMLPKDQIQLLLVLILIIQILQSMSRPPLVKGRTSQKKLVPSNFRVTQPLKIQHQQEQFNIYTKQSRLQSEQQSNKSQSSFELDSDEEPQEQDKQNIKKVLQRLGLHQKVAAQNRNQQLQIVVNNFVENCIGSIDRTANTEEYDKVYHSDYQEKLKTVTPYSSVFISELTQLQKIRKASDSGLWIIYKSVRIFLKYCSMACDKIVQHVLFQAFILVVIMLNSLKMATDDATATNPNLPAVQTAFTTIYTVQMVLKIFAYGFVFNKKAYLRDLWNILDFVIVVTSLLPLVVNLGFSVTALRAVRVLRPLRTITKVKALKMIVKTLFNSFSLVMDSLAILMFVMCVFAIAGMQLFSGDLKLQCMVQATGAMSTNLCASNGSCPIGSICVKGISNPNFSIINFDTFLWSFMSVFQTISTQGWSQIAIGIQKTKGFIYFIYSILIIFICLYILLNMTMAILKYKYGQVKQNVNEEQEEEKQEYQLQFLKKLGILKDISLLSQHPPLLRTSDKTKKQVGCSSSLPPQIKKVDLSTEALIAYLQAPKTTLKLQKEDLNEVNLKQLRQLGKVTDYKWDANNLQFETNQLQEKDFCLKKDQQKDQQQKTLGEKQEEEQLSQESFSDGQNSSDFSSQLEYQKQQIADKVFELQKRLNAAGGDQGEFQDNKGLKIQQKPAQNPLIAINLQQKVSRQVSDFEKLLELIGSKPGVVSNEDKKQFFLPDFDIKKVTIQNIYQRFADLGQYKMPKIKKQNQLITINIAKKVTKPNQIKKQIGIVKEIVQQSALDLKQLHLKNHLQKSELRCRVKGDQLIDAQRSYDVTRIIESKKVKEIQKKKNEIKQNLNTLHFNVKYKAGDNTKTSPENNKFIRNLLNNKIILKVPQITSGKEKTQKNQKDIVKQNGQKQKHKDHYLKLLQNHSVQDKIQLNLDRVVNVFFRKQVERKKKIYANKVKISAVQEYDQIIQEDILKRHGHLQLQLPFYMKQPLEMVNSMNMKQAQYQIHIKGLFGAIRVFRKKLLFIVSDPLYDNFMLVVVLFNTLLMALNGYLPTDSSPYSNINQAFTFIFVTDVTFKILAYGIKFFGDMMNLFDTAVVSVSLIELFLGGGGSSNLSALRSIRILRAFRVLRITRLIRSLSYMRVIMGVVNSVITEFMYVFVLLWLFIFIYTLLGMQIFGGTFVHQNVTGIRQNYDSFFNALFSIFQVLTGQNWNDIQTVTALSSQGQYSIIFLVSWIFIGNWILLNLLQAVLLDGFDDDATDPQQQVAEQVEQNDTAQVDEPEEETQLVSKSQQSQVQQGLSTTKSVVLDLDDASLYMFTAKNPIRRFAKALITSSIFQAFMFIAIITSSLKLAFDTYIDTGASQALYFFSQIADYTFTGIFLVEFAMKIIYLGFIIGQNAYLKNSWNKLDFFIVLVSITDLSLQGINLSIIKLMRTLRALRIITRNQEMKIMVSSIAESIMGIFNVLIICLCVFLMFAILGMSLLQGKLNFCNVTGAQLIYNNYGPYNITQTQCVAQGGVWTTQLINFQNIGNAMMSLYVFATRQNWPYYVYTFIDANETGPVLNNNQLLFFVFTVIFLFVGTYFFMDLLIGVMFMNYHESESKIRPQLLSDKQINWKNLQKLIVSEDPCFQLYIAPTNPFLKKIFKIISNTAFQIFISSVIIVNIFVMALSNDDLHKNTQANLAIINSICSYVFILELSLKLITFGRAYFLSAWNIFDFVVVAASILDILLQYAGSQNSAVSNLSFLPQIARIFRVLRITRLLRTFKSFKGLQKLIQTFVFSLPAISKGLAIFGLYLFISSILASYLLGSIEKDYSGIYNSYLNYSTFHTAFQTLFTNITGQNWYVFMFFSTTPGYAVCTDGTSSCINSYYYVFWFPYIFLAQKVFQELFVLIVLDQFENNYINEHNPLGIFALLEEDFRQNWLKATEKHHFQKIQSKRLVDLLLLLRPPLGLGRDQIINKYTDELEVNQKITKQEVTKKLIQLDQKLKRNAARLIHKMNILKNRIYFGYHQTFYHFARLSIFPECLQNAKPQQKQSLVAMQKDVEQTLDKIKPEGALYYYDQLSNDAQNPNTPLNPISLILFTQIIIKSWHNYSSKIKQSSANENKKKKDQQDSMDKSCASDIEEAKYEKISNDRKIITRRGGLLENKLQNQPISCEFKQIPNMCSAYGEGKRMKHKISIMNKRGSRISSHRASILNNNSVASIEKMQYQFNSFKS